jgi:hypothetical protein
MQSEAKHREVRKEHAAAKPVGGLRKRHRGQNLVAKRRQKPKEQTLVNYGSRRKLIVAVLKMTHRTIVAGCKKHIIGKNWTRDKVVRGTLKRRTLGRKHPPKPECKIGIKNPGTRWQLRLKIGRTSEGFDRKAFGLEFM